MLLVLANVLFFGWERVMRQDGEPGVERVSERGANRLEQPTQADEGDKDALPVEVTEPSEGEVVATDEPTETVVAETPAIEASIAEDVPAAPFCLSVGPFDAVTAASNAMKALRTQEATVAQRAVGDQVLSGHWVYVDKIATRAEARRLQQQLKGAGITDASIFAGDEGDLISLGLFSVLAGAERTRDRAKSLGINASLVPRYRDGNVYWLDVQTADVMIPDSLRDEYGSERVLAGVDAQCPPT